MNQRDLCLTCHRSRATCFCGFVKPFDTRTRFVLLMHPKEFKRQTTGTGRLTRLALRNSEIIMGVDFSADRRLNELLADPRYYPVVLFPSQSSVNVSEAASWDVPVGRVPMIVIIDGTWRLARKIVHVNQHLHNLPCISFTPPEPSRFLIKRQPAAHCVSTIEAVYYLLGSMERLGLESLEGRQNTLIGAIDALVAFQQHYLVPGVMSPRHLVRKRARARCTTSLE